MIALQVKRNKDRFEFDVDANATVDDVFSSIEEKTNTLKRTMKLIVNGKTLTAFDDGKKIFAEVVKKKGNKVTAMLLDGAPLLGGGGSTSSGAAMASSVAEKRRREAKEKMMAQKDERAKERRVLRIEFIVLPEREVHEQSVWFLRMRVRGKVFVQSNRKRGRRSRHVRSV